MFIYIIINKKIYNIKLYHDYYGSRESNESNESPNYKYISS